MSRQLTIICNHTFRTAIQKHSKFEHDLGRTYTKRDDKGVTMDIKDSLVFDFYKQYSKLIYRAGRIGTIMIYTYSELEENEVVVKVNGHFHTDTFNVNDIYESPEKFLYLLIQEAERKDA